MTADWPCVTVPALTMLDIDEQQHYSPSSIDRNVWQDFQNLQEMVEGGKVVRKLEGRVAIVTGAGQGIGRGIALAFAKEGAKVAIVDLIEELGEAVASEIRGLGEQALFVVCDVGSEDQVKGMVDHVASQLGPIDVLVNCAQYRQHGLGVENFPEDVWDRTFQVGVKATLFTCKAVFPYMKEHGGKIINFGSKAGLVGHANMAAYAANKEAIRGLTRVAAREWAKYKINVNVVCPAAKTPTQLKAAELAPETMKVFEQAIPMGRLGDPERDIAPAVVFLASQDSDYITGMTFLVDGGSAMHA